jgi:biotin transporter BioY
VESQTLQRTIFAAIFVLLLGVINGCSIKQTVKPVELTGQSMEICIIKNERVRQGFLDGNT